MALENETARRLVISLVPSLSRSLSEQFNVFRVMHHGTHEKQLSNVFAWLLRPDGTHDLGYAFQRIFMGRVNSLLPTESHFHTSGYRVTQEVDTSGEAAIGKDIADIVLTAPHESVVIENFGTSDGHGHDYEGYLAHGALGGRRSVVVLLCIRKESGLRTDGWEQAIVLAYAELLSDLQDHIRSDRKWRRDHPQQYFFVRQLVDNFVEGPSAVSAEDRIEFIKTMCETGESARYGQRPQDAAAEQFAETVAQHAKQQFEQGRETLATVKRRLRSYTETCILSQLNENASKPFATAVKANHVGAWEWDVMIYGPKGTPLVASLLFGPTAATVHERDPEQVERPDFSKVFVLVRTTGEIPAEYLFQTNVGLDEVHSGLQHSDRRIADAVLSSLRRAGVTFLGG
ncbi:MAG: PD-(D/E)XK nuclease family protein [Gulosibacter sp.]|uniref:PD-(D/E)XK nuclease family protein n=1 Tax=Gulosibacter sp. TaxID=2817531 RepID=UPI003F8E4A4D